MKTIIKDGVYERVSDEVGDFKVRNQNYKFVPKKEWKENVRDPHTKLPKEKLSTEETVVKKKNYQKSKKS